MLFRLFGLSHEYWRPRILFAIESGVGTPICIDVYASKFRVDLTFGQFVWVLVDMDLVEPLNYNVLVEKEGFTFLAYIEYENIPELCSHCRKLGHSVKNCKLFNKSQHKPAYVSKTKKLIRGRMKWLMTLLLLINWHKKGSTCSAWGVSSGTSHSF